MFSTGDRRKVRRHARAALLAAALLALATGAAACSEPEPESGGGATVTTASEGAGGASTTAGGSDATEPEGGDGGDSVVGEFAGEDWFLGEIPAEPVAADPALEPVRIGIINQENTPLGSFPEVRRAVEGAVAFANAELGGIGGRPLQLSTCVTSFSPEQSAACAQQMVADDVVALVGGLDVTSNGSIPILEQNGIPQIGGIPANLVEQQSAVTFFLSGGVTGGIVAFLEHAAQQGAGTVVLGYGEFDAFRAAVEQYAVPFAQSLGLDLELVTFPVTATDFLPVLTRAAEAEPDAVILAAAGSSCAPIMTTFRDLGIDAQLYLVGACAADEIIQAADGAQAGVIFNSEGPPAGEGDVEGALFAAVNERYAAGEGGGAGTVGMRGFFALYGLLDELGPDGVSREAVLDLVRSAVDRPSFWGHPYTCDGQQVPGLGSLCAPQQSLITVDAPGDVVTITDEWIDVATLLRDSS